MARQWFDFVTATSSHKIYIFSYSSYTKSQKSTILWSVINLLDGWGHLSPRDASLRRIATKRARAKREKESEKKKSQISMARLQKQEKQKPEQTQTHIIAKDATRSFHSITMQAIPTAAHGST